MGNRSDAEILLKDSATNIQAWVETKNLLPAAGTVANFLDQQSWTAATRLARSTEPLVHYCINVVATIVPEDVETISEALHIQLGQACTSGWVGTRSSLEADVAVGFVAHLRRWLQDLQASARLTTGLDIHVIGPQHLNKQITFRTQAASYAILAALDNYTEEAREDSYHLKLARIRSALAINSSELAALLHVSREAVRKWDRGDSISSERWEGIDQLYSDVEKLQEYIKPESLPVVVRRKIPALSNRTPLDLLASQRTNELLSLYEDLTSYQTPI
jgi:DNA-binding transcriptional regulator YiaG